MNHFYECYDYFDAIVHYYMTNDNNDNKIEDVLIHVTRFLQRYFFAHSDKSVAVKDQFRFFFERHQYWTQKIFGYQGFMSVISMGVFHFMKRLSQLYFVRSFPIGYYI